MQAWMAGGARSIEEVLLTLAHELAHVVVWRHGPRHRMVQANLEPIVQAAYVRAVRELREAVGAERIAAEKKSHKKESA